MRVKELTLQNYRGFEDLALEFGPRFNVIVGQNGSGKTSVLRALVDALNAWVSHVQEGGPQHSTMADENVVFTKALRINGTYRFERHYPCTVSISVEIPDGTTGWQMAKSGPTDLNLNGANLGLTYRNAMNLPTDSPAARQPLPIAAFYQAQRQWRKYQQHEIQSVTQKLARGNAYQNWFDAAAGADLILWAISKSIERLETATERGVPFDAVKDDELAMVNEALRSAMEGAKGLRYDLKAKTLVLEWLIEERRPTWFDQLSDGQRAIVGLITDIARRMCVLNPHIGTGVTKSTPGIVLIDELDVHLHPRWQRMLPKALKAAFPEVQFIVTSHSPQVLGELEPDEIIVLAAGTSTQPEVSYGLSASQVLEEIMDAPARSEAIDRLVKTIYQLLEENRVDEAKSQLVVLKKIAPGIPDLDGAQALIRRKELLGR